MKTGYRITSPKEGEETICQLNVLGRSIDDTLLWVRAALEEGKTKIVITEEDRAVRDLRRSYGLSGDVECEGPMGYRCAKEKPLQA